MTGVSQAAVRAFGGSANTQADLDVAVSGSTHVSQGKFKQRDLKKNAKRKPMFNGAQESVVPVADNTFVEISNPAVTVTIPLVISPVSVSLTSSETLVFAATGGISPYTYNVVADTTGGAVVNSTTGQYTAGPSEGNSTMRVTDYLGATAIATVTVIVAAPVTINPTSGTVASGGQQMFIGGGGTPPYTFRLVENTSNGASVNTTTGQYQAGSTGGNSTVRVVDKDGRRANAIVTVSPSPPLLTQALTPPPTSLPSTPPSTPPSPTQTPTPIPTPTVTTVSGKHLFMLSGQSNMVQLDPNTSFTPALKNKFSNENVIVVKDALGGAPIRRWYKGWRSASGNRPAATGDLYDRLLGKVNQAIQGQTIQTMTFVWMQGEQDAFEKHGEVYEASLRGLIAQLRTDLGRQDINFIIGRLSDFAPGDPVVAANWLLIRAAQVAIGEADPFGAWVNADGLPRVQNDLHFTTAGYNLFGQRFADEAIQRINCLSSGPGCVQGGSNSNASLNVENVVTRSFTAVTSRSLTPLSPRVLAPVSGQPTFLFQQAGGNGNAIKAFGGSANTNVDLGVAASGSTDLSRGKFLLRQPKNVERRDMFNKPDESTSDTNDNTDFLVPVVTVSVPLSISPLTVPLASGGQQVFAAIGGVPPYTFSVVADTTGGAIVNATTGLYSAGPAVGTSRVRATDANFDTAEAGVTVVAFGIAPTSVVITSGGQQAFSGISGLPPYTFSVVTDTTGGANVNATTGLYTPGPNAGTSTVRLTDSNMETVDAGITVQTTTTALNQSPWSVQSVSSQLSSARGAAKAIDGNPTTNWTTSHSTSVSPPHNLEINLGGVFEIEGFRVLPRLPSQGIMTSFYEFYVSEDGQTWGEPVAAGELAAVHTEQEVRFPRVAGRYVRLRPLGEHNGRNFIILSELNVLGSAFSGNFAPNGTITTPTSTLTISAGSSVSFSGTFTDSNGHSASSYVWDFGDPTIADSTQEDPGAVVFPNPGTYTVTYTVTDSFGLADPYPDSVTVKVGTTTTLPRTNWRIHYVNSEEVTQANRVAENVLDGNASTIWQTQLTDVGRPHDIQIDLGQAYRLDALRYRPPGSVGINGRILGYHIYISADGAEWGAPVAIGSFVSSSAEQRVAFPPKTGQFVRLVALTSVNGNPTAAMAEINLEGQCALPFVELIEPLTQEVQAGPGLRVTASVCLAQPSHAGWGVRLSVGGQQQTIPFPSNGQITPTTFQRTFAGVSGDNLQVSAVIVNAGGTPVAGADTSDTVTQVGIGDVYAGIGDSTTVGVGDDDTIDATSQDGRNTNTGVGFAPTLNNILTTKRGYPHDVLNFGYSGESSSGALIRTPKLVRARPTNTHFLVSVGINDALTGLIPSGQGQNPPGPGTFKANLQSLIDLLHDPSQGRLVSLSKVMFNTVPSAQADLLAFNLAIEELAASNGLTVVPPDFFMHFQTNQQELRADGVHPTGVGYRSISTLWCEALTGGSCPTP